MRYTMKQKLFSLRDSFKIFDQNDELAFIAKGGFFSIRKGLRLMLPNETEVARIKQKLIAWRPTFYITLVTGERCKIKKCFWPLFTSRFVLTTPKAEVVVDGDLLSHEYQFVAAGEQIAYVSKRWFSLGDSYGIDIKYEEDIPLMLAAVATIDLVNHNDNGAFDSD